MEDLLSRTWSGWFRSWSVGSSRPRGKQHKRELPDVGLWIGAVFDAAGINRDGRVVQAGGYLVDAIDADEESLVLWLEK